MSRLRELDHEAHGRTLADQLHPNLGVWPSSDERSGGCRNPQRVIGQRQNDPRRPRVALPLVVSDTPRQSAEATRGSDKAGVVHPPRVHLYLRAHGRSLPGRDH